MPEHVRSIECCYCSASTLVNLRNVDENSMKCGECGAGMAIDKMSHIGRPAPEDVFKDTKKDIKEDTKDKEGGRATKERKRKRKKRYDDDDRKKRSKHKKKKNLWDRLKDRLKDLWDDIEDIFD